MRTAAQILASAVDRGAISPDRVDHYLKRYQDGEDITWLDRAQGNIFAHSSEHVRRRAHQAIDDAFGNGRQGAPGDRTDEFGRLFPPSKPLGDDEEEQTHFAPKKRTRVELPPKRKRASAGRELTGDEELFEQMYGYIPDPSYFED